MGGWSGGEGDEDEDDEEDDEEGRRLGAYCCVVVRILDSSSQLLETSVDLVAALQAVATSAATAGGGGSAPGSAAVAVDTNEDANSNTSVWVPVCLSAEASDDAGISSGDDRIDLAGSFGSGGHGSGIGRDIGTMSGAPRGRFHEAEADGAAGGGGGGAAAAATTGGGAATGGGGGEEAKGGSGGGGGGGGGIQVRASADPGSATIEVTTLIPGGVKPSLPEGATLVETLVLENDGLWLHQRIEVYVPLTAGGVGIGGAGTGGGGGGPNPKPRRGEPAATVDRILVRLTPAVASSPKDAWFLRLQG
eukprot:g6243.t1